MITPTTMNLSILPTFGAPEVLCMELQRNNFSIEALREEACVLGSDNSRIFRVIDGHVDKELLRSYVEKNTIIQQWINECISAVKGCSSGSVASKEHRVDCSFIAFRSNNDTVRVRVEKHVEDLGAKHKRHEIYTPFISINPRLHLACCVAVEQTSSMKLLECYTGLGTEIRLQPRIQEEGVNGSAPRLLDPVKGHSSSHQTRSDCCLL